MSAPEPSRWAQAARPNGRALAIGFAGAGAVAMSGLPAGALVGATLAVGAAAASGWHVDLDPRLREGAFAVIGLSLGAGIEPGMVTQVGAWSLSLAGLIASLLVTVFLGTWLLQSRLAMDRETAVLSSVPGTMSSALAIAANSGRGDVSQILILQLMRLQSLVVVSPPLALLLGTPASQGAAGAAAMPIVALVGLLALALLVAVPLTRIGLPAAAMLAGMIISGTAHLTGMIPGTVPGWALFVAFGVAGCGLGNRLTKVSWSRLRALLGNGTLLLTVSVAVSLAFAAAVSGLTGLSLGQVWIAYAPGAVEAMAAIGFALGYDPGYVALHHILRIVTLLLLLQILIKR